MTKDAFASFAVFRQRIHTFNRWDLVAIVTILAGLYALAWLAKQMSLPYHIGTPIHISLSPKALPGYALQTVLRMGIALMCSLVFTFIFGTWAAKSKKAAMIIIPLIDILQSIPVLGFLQITLVGFITLFPGTLFGPECTSIFAIFTAQAWNMTLSLYQGLRSTPSDLKEAAAVFHLSNWQRYWRVEVPCCVPSLLWNTMMSMSGSWFFVVASEAISVANQNIPLPGIGSYINEAINQGNAYAIGYAILAMLIVILIYDQLLFCPLIAWAEKFKQIEDSPVSYIPSSWVIDLLQKTKVIKHMGVAFTILSEKFVRFGERFRPRRVIIKNKPHMKYLKKGLLYTIYLGGILLLYACCNFLYLWLTENWEILPIRHVFFLGLCTWLRVFSLLVICSFIWVPVGVWIGLRPNIRYIAQPIVQFLAAFPANLLFPVVVGCIVHYNLNVEIWTTPLIILGSQWYLLFNVIAGASLLPKDLSQVCANFGITGWLWWKKLILPGIFPYYLTGLITAAGGAWNASIIAEYVNWNGITLKATGLGSYITEYTHLGAFPQTALGITVMSCFVVVINKILWRPLYRIAQERFMAEG